MYKKAALFPIFMAFIVAMVTLLSGCKFPDNIPDWQNLQDYKLSKLEFGKTNTDEFIKLAPECPITKVPDNIVIYTIEPTETEQYQKIRVGFKDNLLDWIEFTIKPEISISQVVTLYGEPTNINKTYSKALDYYDYVFFNISTDKKHDFARQITFFDISPAVKADKGFKTSAYDWQNMILSSWLKPGQTLEADFNTKFPDLVPEKNDKFDPNSTYILDTEIQIARLYYNKVVLNFNNGLLASISLYPKNMTLEQAIEKYGSDFKIEPMDDKHDIYEYAATILVVDKKTKKVVNIGML